MIVRLTITFLLIAGVFFIGLISCRRSIEPFEPKGEYGSPERQKYRYKYYKRNKGRTEILHLTVRPYDDDVPFHPLEGKRIIATDQKGQIGVYTHIDGFDFEEGYSYEIKVERKLVYDTDDAPQDASLASYKLIRVIRKEEAKGKKLLR